MAHSACSPASVSISKRVAPGWVRRQRFEHLYKARGPKLIQLQPTHRHTRQPVMVKATAVEEPSQEAKAQLERKLLARMQAPEVSDDANRWSQRNYNTNKRRLDIWSFALGLRARQLLVDQKWTYPGGYTDEKASVRKRQTASWVRERILQLGPTFIKLGQLFSTRADILSNEYVEELSKLQDRVPAFSPAIAMDVLAEELGPDILHEFAQFDPYPVAAASLGQVHFARLKSGEDVAVKIQRPALQQLFDVDLKELRKLAMLLERNAEDDSTDFVGIYDEYAKVLNEEIDYILEGGNADRFRRDFKEQNWVKVPRIFWQYTTPRVLVMEYLPGVKINDKTALEAMSIDTSLIAQRATEAYLLQILRTGFFHADPHPGNVAVDLSTSQLIYYDFGMMGQIVPVTRARLTQAFNAVADKDAATLIDALSDLGLVQSTGDSISLRRSLQFWIENVNQKVERKETLNVIGEDLFAVALDSPFRFPATFTFVLRAFSTLEGIGKSLDPKFSFVTIATPYAQELFDQKQSQQDFLLEELQKQAEAVSTAALSMPQRVERIEEIIGALEAGDLKIRVRNLEAERVARKQSVMQLATIHTVCAVGLLNVGVQLALAEKGGMASVAFVAAMSFSFLVRQSFKRVKRLDEFERNVKGNGKSSSS